MLLLVGVAVACSRRMIDEQRLAEYRNLGKAFYENPTTPEQAAEEFRKALALDPSSAREKLNYALALLRTGKSAAAIPLLEEVQKQAPELPHTWFNLGIDFKRQGDAGRAIVQFERMIQLAPQEPIGHYQLGALYRQVNRMEDARLQFERATALDPLLGAAQYQLYTLHRQMDQPAEAERYLTGFQRIQQQKQGAVIREDVEWCAYAEIYDPPATLPEPAAPEPVVDDSIVARGASGLTVLDVENDGKPDLVVWSADGIRIVAGGTQPAASAGLEGLAEVIQVVPGDFNNDGWMDLCVLTSAGPRLYRNDRGRFVRQSATLPERRFEAAVWMDTDHDYDLDLILLGDRPALLRNQGPAGFGDRGVDFPFVSGQVIEARKLRVENDSKAFDLAVFYRNRTAVLYRDQLGGRYTVEASADTPSSGNSQAEADFDADGQLDRALVAADGSVHLLRNRGNPARRWIRIQLAGVKSLKLAQDAQVEIKAGALYRKVMYAGLPLVVDVGAHTIVDTVRITWPNGLIQNEVRQASNTSHSYQEAQRLSGSCPMIWTWNGHEFQFITDVLGVAPLGASDGDGSYFPVDHDEYVSIPGAALSPVQGQYQIRVTEELSEVSYLDEIELLAVDHPAHTELFTNEKFKGPPYPEFKLFGVERRVYPLEARDNHGRDVLPRITARDQKYPDQFQRTGNGVAELHTLELDFGRATGPGAALLLLNGWVDWPDGSTFRAASQEQPGGLVMPYIEVQDAQGQWKTVDKDMGMPAGKPKTIAVPLVFPAAQRKVRIVTNLCVYWDEIFLSAGTSLAEAHASKVPMERAALRFRGFSASRIHPQRLQPDTFVYSQVSSQSYWNPTPGLYTRYGPVEELLRDVDDRLAILGSGDEVELRFRADALGPVKPGWTRDFLLKVDGWAKDRDPNTAFSTSVEPLPFHAMSRYPYPPAEYFPSDASHRTYVEQYNKRPALVLIRPLETHH
jgi:hypothetical protein